MAELSNSFCSRFVLGFESLLFRHSIQRCSSQSQFSVKVVRFRVEGLAAMNSDVFASQPSVR